MDIPDAVLVRTSSMPVGEYIQGVSFPDALSSERRRHCTRHWQAAFRGLMIAKSLARSLTRAAHRHGVTGAGMPVTVPCQSRHCYAMMQCHDGESRESIEPLNFKFSSLLYVTLLEVPSQVQVDPDSDIRVIMASASKTCRKFRPVMCLVYPSHMTSRFIYLSYI